MNIFKGANKAVARLVARRISKEDFLDQLKAAWTPLVHKDTDIGVEETAAWERIEKSGFEAVFRTVGVTEDDIYTLLEEIRDEKTSPVTIGPKVGRNESCPCGSGKKYKKCCISLEEL